jgi:anti-sigma factor RsiW
MRSSNRLFSQLVDLVDDRLAPEEKATLLGRLADDPQAAAQAAQIARVVGIMRDDLIEEPPAEVIERFTRLFRERYTRRSPGLRERLLAALKFDTWQQPMALGLRAAQPTTRQMLFQAGEHDLHVRISPLGSLWSIQGQVLGANMGGNVALHGSDIALEADLNELHEFTLPPVPAGSYTLTLHTGELDIEIPELEIKV